MGRSPSLLTGAALSLGAVLVVGGCTADDAPAPDAGTSRGAAPTGAAATGTPAPPAEGPTAAATVASTPATSVPLPAPVDGMLSSVELEPQSADGSSTRGFTAVLTERADPGRDYEVRVSCRTRPPGEPVEVLVQDTSVDPAPVDPAEDGAPTYLLSSEVPCDGAVHVVPLPSTTGTPLADFSAPADELVLAWAVVVPVEPPG